MKILVATANNFCSYADLIFDVRREGLTLINGPTGSGKSVLCDLIPWVLFGATTKGGAADEVISWKGGVTQGTLMLEHNNLLISVVRKRGKGENDLFFYYDDKDGQIRGKDLKDTQKLLNDALGVDVDTYLSGAYFHEFCTSANFFTATAKSRRETIEQIVDLSLHKRLIERTKELLKKATAEVVTTQLSMSSSTSALVYLDKVLKQTMDNADKWEQRRGEKLAELITKAHNFSSDLEKKVAVLQEKADVWELRRSTAIIRETERMTKAQSQDPDVCPECGGPVHKDKTQIIAECQTLIDDLRNEPNPYVVEMVNAQMEENAYGKQAEELEIEENPHNESLLSHARSVSETKKSVKDLETKLDKLKADVLDLELLQEVAVMFRAKTVKNTVEHVEVTTNQLISQYFDGEIQLQLNISGEDKLDVVTFKDGNKCAFTQLSKGQRQILKLAFGVSVMEAVSNEHGVKFEQLFFDEAMSGLDETLKCKSFQLFEKLTSERSSVFVIDHSIGFKEMFAHKINVSLVAGNSVLNEE